MKLTIIQSEKREFETEKGEEISGFQCAGYTPDGQLLEFWSIKDHSGDVVFATGFLKEYALEIELKTKIFGGKVKYSEKE